MCQGATPKDGQIVSASILYEPKVCLMIIAEYRKSLPGRSTRVSFVQWLNGELVRFEMKISIGYLRDLEYGRKTPSLPLAIGIEKATGGAVSVREWPGLSARLRL